MDTSELSRKIAATALLQVTLERSGDSYIVTVHNVSPRSGRQELCYTQRFSEPVAAMLAAEQYRHHQHCKECA